MIHSDEIKYSKMERKNTNRMEIMARPESLERYKMTVQLVRACVKLYGIVDCDFIIRQIARLPEADDLILHDYIALIDSLVQEDDKLLQQGPWLYSRLFCPSPEHLSDLLEEQICLPYRESSIESLLPYADDDYYEQTEEIETLKAYLADHCVAADRLISIVGCGLRHASTDDVLTQRLADVDCSCLDMDKLRSLILAAEYVTRKVSLRGHTLQEEKALCDKWQSPDLILT